MKLGRSKQGGCGLGMLFGIPLGAARRGYV